MDAGRRERLRLHRLHPPRPVRHLCHPAHRRRLRGPAAHPVRAVRGPRAGKCQHSRHGGPERLGQRRTLHFQCRTGTDCCPAGQHQQHRGGRVCIPGRGCCRPRRRAGPGRRSGTERERQKRCSGPACAGRGCPAPACAAGSRLPAAGSEREPRHRCPAHRHYAPARPDALCAQQHPAGRKDPRPGAHRPAIRRGCAGGRHPDPCACLRRAAGQHDRRLCAAHPGPAALRREKSAHHRQHCRRVDRCGKDGRPAHAGCRPDRLLYPAGGRRQIRHAVHPAACYGGSAGRREGGRLSGRGCGRHPQRQDPQ